MFETSLDAWYAWFGVAVASSAVFGVALGLPTAATPTVAPVADTVDEVASSSYEPEQTLSLDAQELKLDPQGISVRTAGGTVHRTFVYGPITPVTDGPLRAVLDGKAPETVFENKHTFLATLEHAHTRAATWRPAPETLTIRRVTWGETDATLVG
jgi:hypothetical protein